MPHRNKENGKAWRREWLKTDKGRRWRFAYNVLARVGLNFKIFSELIVDQRGLCANLGCQKQLIGKHEPCVDHDHSCCPGPKSCRKCVRGLLCYSCNIALGHVSDSITKLIGLQTYLKKVEN